MIQFRNIDHDPNVSRSDRAQGLIKLLRLVLARGCSFFQMVSTITPSTQEFDVTVATYSENTWLRAQFMRVPLEHIPAYLHHFFCPANYFDTLRVSDRVIGVQTIYRRNAGNTLLVKEIRNFYDLSVDIEEHEMKFYFGSDLESDSLSLSSWSKFRDLIDSIARLKEGTTQITFDMLRMRFFSFSLWQSSRVARLRAAFQEFLFSPDCPIYGREYMPSFLSPASICVIKPYGGFRIPGAWATIAYLGCNSTYKGMTSLKQFESLLTPYKS